MRLSLAKPQSDRTVLTGGLRRVLWGVIIAVFTLVTVQVISVGRLQDEIGHWASVARINAEREKLQDTVRRNLDGAQVESLPEVMIAFSALRRSIQAFIDIDHAHSMAEELSGLEDQARRLFLEAGERESAIAPSRSAILRAVEQLQRLASEWMSALRAEEVLVLRESDDIEQHLREIAETRTALTGALLSAQELQQQLAGVQRLMETSPADVVASSIRALDPSVLPAPCGPGEQETGDRLCLPNTLRVNAALNQVQQAPLGERAARLRLMQMALDGYIRAGQMRLRTISADQSETLDAAQTARQQLSTLRDINASLGRVSRVISDLDTIMRAPVNSAEDLQRAHGQVVSLTSQIGIRVAGLLAMSDGLDGNLADVQGELTTIRRNWQSVRQNLADRIDLLDAFGLTMQALSSEIAARADAVGEETALWVNVYATAFLILATILGVSVSGLVWMARRRFLAPLERVTAAILRLAQGDLGQPFEVSERAFGFNKLGDALEQLRGEMAERHALSERNLEQQRIIESNMAALKRSSEEMEWLALHDPLTELRNRRHADQDLAALSKASLQTGADFCVVQIDIDRFKAINDALGHAAGDHVLKTVSDLLVEISGPAAHCYRVGGDEFLVIYKNAIQEAELQSIADALIAQIGQPIDYNGNLCRVGASIGISFGRDAGFDAVLATMNADLALYEVKRGGRDGYRFFSGDLASASRRRKEISDRLLAAVENKALTPFYQPQFMAGTMELRGVEVLCRWHDGPSGWVAPSEFLPLADDLGVMAKIDEILFEKVASDLDRLQEMGLSLPRVSFNVTSDRLLRANLAEELSQRIGGKTRIAIELLESMSLDNPSESVAWAIDSLKDNGIDVEIDDFGSYRASLAGLIAVKPQAMKIDQSIVIPITHSARHLDLVKKIIDIGAALDIEVIAEGVETDAHVEKLTELGCNLLQGFGLARPMPFDDLVELRRADAGPRQGSKAIA